MIPSDLAARLRFLHEASLFETSPPAAGLQRTREIQSQLQDLMPGQRFLATLQRTLPDGTFRALVAGQQLTLSLNGTAKAGDTLELIATSVTPKLVLARLATPDSAATLASSARPILSPTGQLISFLLTGQPPASPTSLAGQQALLNTLPAPGGNAANASANANASAGTSAQVGTNANISASAATSSASAGISTQLAPLLRQALAQSGLFYEAHQVQWLSGKIDLATLLREPQAQSGQTLPGQTPAGNAPGAGTSAASAQAPSTPSGPASTSASAASAGSARAESAAATSTNATVQALARNEEAIARISSTLRQSAEDALRGPIAERLLPLVHQQLEALATQQYVWHGLAWPGQPFEWLIEDPGSEGHEDGDGKDASEEWDSTLRLTLPRLGGIEALVRLNDGGVTLRMTVDDATTLAALEAGRDELTEALAAANVPLAGMLVEQRDD
jgi:hypothetical protein